MLDSCVDDCMGKLVNLDYKKADSFREDAVKIMGHENFGILLGRTVCVLEKLINGGKIKTIYTVKRSQDVINIKVNRENRVRDAKKRRKIWIYVYNEYYQATHVTNNQAHYRMSHRTELRRLDNQKLADRVEQYENDCLKKLII